MLLCATCAGSGRPFYPSMMQMSACFACGKLTVCYDVQPWTDDDERADDAEHVYDSDRCGDFED